VRAGRALPALRPLDSLEVAFLSHFGPRAATNSRNAKGKSSISHFIAVLSSSHPLLSRIRRVESTYPIIEGGVPMPDTKVRSTKATALLRADHKKVKHLFSQYEKLGDDADRETKRELFEEMKKELTIHATVEEEIFYPAIESLNTEDEKAGEIVSEANEEHKIVKTLLEELTQLDPDDDQYDAKIKVLTESVKHHADEEEAEMFPFFDDLDKERQEQISNELNERKAYLLQDYEDEGL
jgi:hemerythrin superfamily protein